MYGPQAIPQERPPEESICEYAKLGAPPAPGPGVGLTKLDNPWRKFYRGREGDSYRRYCNKRYEVFLSQLHREIRARDTVLEVGCGVGTMSWLLSQHNQDNTLVALDRDQQMVAEAKTQLEGRALVLHADMRNSGWVRAEVVFGHGVIEHLCDLDIYRTLEAHRRSGARVAIHYVPGANYGNQSFGDERLLPLSWWTEKWDTDDAFTFNGGLDYCLIWRF